MINFIKANNLRIFFAVFAVLVLLACSFYLKNTWDRSSADNAAQVLKLARISETALNGEMFKLLRALPEDVGTVPYESIKKRLSDILLIDSNIRFAYIYTEREGKLYFMADSEPATSRDYSPPGQEYSEAASEYYQPFRDGQYLITKPVSDRWGTWVSALVPMKDQAGKVKAVLGIDYPASIWNAQAIDNTTRSGVVVLVVILLVLVFYRLVRSNLELRDSEKKFDSISSSINEALVIMNEHGKVTFWNKAAQDLFGYFPEEIIGKEFCREIVLNEECSAIEIFEKIRDFSPAGQTLEIKVRSKAEREFLVEVSATRVRDNSHWDVIAIMRDITEKKKSEESLTRSAEETKKALVEAERLNNLMIGRELEMFKLKKELSDLKGQSPSPNQKNDEN